MTRHKYEIEYLSDIFENHAQEVEKNNANLLSSFIENNPTSEIPDHFVDPFNISKALAMMAQEIEELKNWKTRHIRNEHPYWVFLTKTAKCQLRVFGPLIMEKSVLMASVLTLPAVIRLFCAIAMRRHLKQTSIGQ